ncbi:hypothetical protein GF378_02200 [Candidatus Pacearchaeota archaeon]|nr:hypothetical protein [Candidatus Pacearchaeota archaeon]
MTRDITAKHIKELNDDSSRLAKVAHEFYDVSFRKSDIGETPSERTKRVLEYFEKLDKEEKEFIEYQFSSVLGYLRQECFE